MFIAKLQKKEGKLVYTTEKEKLAYQLFLDTLQEGDEVEFFINRQGKVGSLAQITKVHTCIRILAEEAGYAFNEMKKLVNNSDDNTVKEFISSFDTKCSSMFQTLQQPVYSVLQASEDRIQTNIQVVREATLNSQIKNDSTM